MENAEVIHHCKEGDKDAMEFLYRRYRHKMMRVIRRYLHEDEAAEDVLHDGFIIIFSRIGEVRNPDRLEFWMATVIKNLCLDYLASLDVTSMLDESEEIADIPELEEIIPYEELLKIIDRLPKGYREIFRLAVLENKSHKEIGKILGINPNSSSSQLFHARQLLRKMVNERKHELGFISLLIALSCSILFLMVKNPRLAPDDATRIASESSVPSKRPVTTPVFKPELKLTQQNPDPNSPRKTAEGNSLLSETAKKEEKINREKFISNPDTLPPLPETGVRDDLQPDAEGNTVARESKDSVSNKLDLRFDGSRIPSDLHSANRIAGIYKRKTDEPWSFSIAYNFGGLSEVHLGYLFLTDTTVTPPDNPNDPPGPGDVMLGDDETPDTEDGKQQNPNTRAATRSLSPPSVSEVENELPLTMAFTLSKHLTPKLSIETGVEYSLAHTSFHLKSVYGDGKRKMRTQYIGLPVRIRYDCLSFSRFTLFSTGGVAVDIPVEHSIVDAQSTSIGVTTIEISKPKIQFSLSAGVGLQFNINSHFGLYIAPSLRYNLPTHSMVPTYWQQHPFCFSIPFGFKATL